jgi:hypothetical protein
VLVLAIAILPWVAASRIGEWRPASTLTVPDTSATIEALTSLLVVASDRPALSFHPKRTDGTRLAATTPTGGLGVSTLPLAWEAWSAVSFTRTAPIAFHLASRGPPLVASA